MNRRLKRLVWGISVSAIVIAPPVVLFSRWMSSSASGDIHVGSTTPHTSSSLTSVTESAPNSLQTPYFSTTLPSGYSVKRQIKAADATAPIQYEVVATTPPTKNQQLAITVGTLTSGGLSEVGDYNLRAKSASYHTFTTPAMPTGAKAFQASSGPPNFTVFSTQGAHYIEVTMSTDGGATLTQLETAYAQIMNSWQK